MQYGSQTTLLKDNKIVDNNNKIVDNNNKIVEGLPSPNLSVQNYCLYVLCAQNLQIMGQHSHNTLADCCLDYIISSRVHDKGLLCEVEFGRTSLVGAQLFFEEIVRGMSMILSNWCFKDDVEGKLC